MFLLRARQNLDAGFFLNRWACKGAWEAAASGILRSSAGYTQRTQRARDEKKEAGTDPHALLAVKLGRRYTGALSSAIVLTQGGVTMKEQLTAVFQKVPEGYIAFVEELPGANSQGDTLEEARANLREAVQLVLEANRSIAKEALGDTSVIREPLAQIS